MGLDLKLVCVGLAGTRQIGSWSAEAVPALATFQPGARGFREVALALAARLRGPFILLGGSARVLDVPARETLAGVGAQFFGLDACIDFSPRGELMPLRTPGELFARFSPKAAAELEENAVRSTFMLVKALDGGQPAGKAPLYTVFRLYCVEGLTIQEVTRRCRCARSLVCLRLRALRQKLGADLRSFRRYSSQFEAMEASLTDSRARRINRYEMGGRELG